MNFSRSVFYDTSAWIALFDRDDTEHEDALQLHQQVSSEKKIIVTTNIVCIETHAYFCHLPKEALKILETIRGSRVLSYQRITVEDEEKGIKLLKKYQDKDLSFCDVCSFVLIERMKIPKAFSYDHHFRQYGIPLLESK